MSHRRAPSPLHLRSPSLRRRRAGTWRARLVVALGLGLGATAGPGMAGAGPLPSPEGQGIAPQGDASEGEGRRGALAGLPSPDELERVAKVVESAPPEAASVPETGGEETTTDTAGDEPDTGESDAAAGKDSEPEAAPAPKPDPAYAVQTLKKPKWIKHVIIPGERLDEIAERYQVRKASLIRWNKLDPKKPRIYAGRKLAIYTKHIPPPQQKIQYTVKRGDTWAKIAAAHHVDADHLRLRWNAKVPRRFKAGQELVIWLDPMNDPAMVQSALGPTSVAASAGTSAAVAARPALPLVNIRRGAISSGKPNRGKIVNGLQLPENPKLYTIRKPEESYGSTHTLHNLQLAIANFRQDTGYTGAIVIGAISKKGGGRLRPHSSHQSGRDVDIRLPVKAGFKGIPQDVSDVDWDATWGLIRALVATGEIQYIFLTTSRQKQLLKAAKRAGASKDMIERVIQYPRKAGTNNGIVRHAKGHTSHIHIRFTCASNESHCESY